MLCVFNVIRVWASIERSNRSYREFVDFSTISKMQLFTFSVIYWNHYRPELNMWWCCVRAKLDMTITRFFCDRMEQYCFLPSFPLTPLFLMGMMSLSLPTQFHSSFWNLIFPKQTTDANNFVCMSACLSYLGIKQGDEWASHSKWKRAGVTPDWSGK